MAAGRQAPAYRGEKEALLKRLRRVAIGLLEDHARHCMIGGGVEGQEERTTELMGAVRGLLRHG